MRTCVDRSETHPRVDESPSKHGWRRKQAWMEHRAMRGTKKEPQRDIPPQLYEY